MKKKKQKKQQRKPARRVSHEIVVKVQATSPTAGEIAADLSNWLAEHPVIGNEDEAREAKVYLDRAKLGVLDLEAERTEKVRPLNEKVKEINEHYKDREHIQLMCQVDNWEAQRVYLKNGFRVVRVAPRYYGIAGDGILMRRTL